MTPSSRATLLAGALLLGAACLTPVGELYCTSAAECAPTARCDRGQCLWPDGGAAGGPGSDAGRPGGGGGAGGGAGGGGVSGPGTSADGGVPVPIGGPCATSDVCSTVAFCVPEQGFSEPTGFPGGACIQVCGACPGGSRCIAAAVQGVNASVCFASCPSPGGQSTCRTGYVCAPDPGGGWCRPRCGNGSLAACVPPQVCGPTGVCT